MARPGRAAYRATVVAAARGLRDGLPSSRKIGPTGSADARVVMPNLSRLTTPVRTDDATLMRVLEAYIATLEAENEILKRRLAAVQAPASQENRGKRLSGRKRQTS